MILETDKRKHPRTRCEVDSSYKNLDLPAALMPSETVVQDISEGGIRFRSSHFVPIKNKLLFKIQIPKRKCIEAVAQPAWIREVPSVNQYDVGAKFLSLSEEDREIIRQFTSSLSVAQ